VLRVVEDCFEDLCAGAVAEDFFGDIAAADGSAGVFAGEGHADEVFGHLVFVVAGVVGAIAGGVGGVRVFLRGCYTAALSWWFRRRGGRFGVRGGGFFLEGVLVVEGEGVGEGLYCAAFSRAA